MTKWRWRWPAILLVSAAMWFIILFVAFSAWAGGLEEAAIRAVDRSACNFQVDQRIINSALYVGALERNLTNKEAFDMAVQLTATLQQQVQESGRVRDYCIARMGQ